MYYKVIYEDPRLTPVKETLAQLDSRQYFFVERYLKLEKHARQQAIFNQWQAFLKETVPPRANG